MIAAEEGLPVRDFTVPDGVEFFDIDRINGTRGGSYKEAYVKGTAPPSSFVPETTEGEAPVDAGTGTGINLDDTGADMLEPIAMLAQ